MNSSDDIRKLLDLPLGTLAILAAGYIGYRIAFTGKDKTHATIDVIFLTLTFAVLAKFISGSLAPWVASGAQTKTAAGWSALASFAGVVVAAAGWRAFGELTVFNTLRRLKVSHSDRYQTAWETVMLRSGTKPSQLIVRKKDGTALMSERLADFAGELLGPCIFGSDGSIALYVTHFKASAGDWEEIGAAATPDWGLPITYIAAAEIGEIEVRMAR